MQMWTRIIHLLLVATMLRRNRAHVLIATLTNAETVGRPVESPA
jgi:hypothetical protein